MQKKPHKILNSPLKGVAAFQELYLNMINIWNMKLSPDILISATGYSIKHAISRSLQQGLKYTQLKTIVSGFFSDRCNHGEGTVAGRILVAALVNV